MPRLLLAGGNGFLGTYLANKAVENGFQVTVIDDLSTSRVSEVPKEVEFIKTRIERYSGKRRFEFVVHLAARPSPEDYMSHPVATLTSNSLGTMKMLELSRASDSVFMYVSSSEVYGNAKVIPTPEDYSGSVSTIGPRGCYNEGKRYSEALAMAYHREYGLDVRIQRPFNIYGPKIREDGFYGRVIPRFINQCLENEPITIFGNGKQTRSFLYVDDWLAGSWKFLVEPRLSGIVLNLGSDQEITINELAELIIRLIPCKSTIKYLEPRSDDPTRRSAEISRALDLLGWKPEFTLVEGLKKTIEFFRERLE